MSLSIAFTHRFLGRSFDIAITAPSPGVIVLFGPSGAGKSTIASVAAGLVRPRDAHVSIDGVILADSISGVFVPPERRRIGMVFQDALLFPHLSVAGNLRYGERRASAQRVPWDEVVALLDLGAVLSRRVASLSGGERQRVAIGRALLSQPRLLIMDEPLASLDLPRRRGILPYLARLRDTLRLPILYITHDLDEAVRLGDTLVLVECGGIAAAGGVHDMLSRADLDIGRREDAGAVLSCTVVSHVPVRGLTRLMIGDGMGLEILVPLLAAAPGSELRVRVPAHDVILARQPPQNISVQNILSAEIVALGTDGAEVLVRLRLGSAHLLARVTEDARARLDLALGRTVFALFKSVAVQVLV